jgi:DNA primase
MPLYSDGLLDEVRNSVSIVSVVSEYVALKKRGRNWVARCPFHVEKTPSFNVNEERQIFMCFGCGVGGDVFKFLMQIEHLTFPQAVHWIADRSGVPLPKAASREVQAEGTDADVLRAAMAEAARYFHRMLLESEEGRGPLGYLQDRGVSRETMARFCLGYAPAGGQALLDHMQRKGVAPALLEECGLIKKSEDGRSYDAFRGRVMFPITDIQGRVIALGGRALGDRQPKYLNSPDTKLYNKSRNLFGLSYAREEIKRADCAVLVEGYMDFVIPFQHGVRNLVASLGTSLTPQQAKLLGRYTRNVVVSYDPDSAGQAATQRSLDLFLEEDFQIRVFCLPQGQDPDAFVRAAGADEYRRRLQESVSYLDFVLDAAIRGQGSLNNPKSKIQVLNAVLPYLAKVPHAVERSEYVFRFARRLNLQDEQMLAEVKRAAQHRKPQLGEAAAGRSGALKFAEKRLLQLLLSQPELQPEILVSCSAEDFQGLATARIFEWILEEYRQGRAATFERLHALLAGEQEQSLLAELQIEEAPEEFCRESAESFLNALRTIRLESRRRQIVSGISEASERQDEEVLNQLIEQRIRVDRELVALSRK